MPSVIKTLTFDTTDALALARFWAAVFGSNVDEDSTPALVRHAQRLTAVPALHALASALPAAWWQAAAARPSGSPPPDPAPRRPRPRD